MQIRWLGWAGVEIAAQGQRVVIDPLADPRVVFARLSEHAHAVSLPAGTPDGLRDWLGPYLAAGARHVILRVADDEFAHGLEAAAEARAALIDDPDGVVR